MIFLDWLLRFHPIIIILLQGQGCYLDTGSWAKTEIMAVSQWLSLGHMVTCQGLSPVCGPPVCNVSCAPDSGH